MSSQEDDIIELGSGDHATPLKSRFLSAARDKKQKRRSKNRILSSPPSKSPRNPPATAATNTTNEVFELFTVQKKTPAQRKNTVRSTVFSDDRLSSDSSNLSDDVFEQVRPKSSAPAKPPVSAISTPSTSAATKSYRDRINERFREVKEKAGKSTKRAGNVFRESAMMLEKIRRESCDVEANIVSVKSRLGLVEKITGGRSEEVDFFLGSAPNNPDEEEDIENDGDNSKSSDNLTRDRKVHSYLPPEKLRSSILSSEEAILFVPKSIPVNLSDKVGVDGPRYREDEGLYVAKDPDIPSKHMNILEQRLIQDGRKWFNCEGNLEIVENPILKTSFRPLIDKPPKGETTIYTQPTTNSSHLDLTPCEEVVVNHENILQIHIDTLKFNHHPLFSLEHVYEHRLRDLIREHQKCQESNKITRLQKRLEALRNVVGNKKHDDTNTSQYEAYHRDIKELREMIFEEAKRERGRIKEILDTWKSVKQVRKDNKCVNTSTRLKIVKEPVDRQVEKKDHDKHFHSTLDEICDDDDDYESLYKSLKSKFRESFKSPGEPNLKFNVTDDELLSSENISTKETTRRNLVSSTKITLKILYSDNVDICRTKSVHLNDKFTCNFDETISIQLTERIPKYLTVEIVEQPKTILRRTVGKMTIKVPPRNISQTNRKVIDREFEKNEIIHYRQHDGIGSGVKVDKIDNELNTKGVLSYSAYWETPIDVSQRIDNIGDDSLAVIGDIVDKYGGIDLEKLSEWVNRSNPDPQDPRNTILYEYSSSLKNEDLEHRVGSNCFRLGPHMGNMLKFCDYEIIEQNLRLTMLSLRDRNEPEFDGMAIPNRPKEIPVHVFEDYKRRIDAEKDQFVDELDDLDGADHEAIERRRSLGRKVLRQVQIKVFQRCKSTENNLTFEDVIDETFVTFLEKMITSIATNFINWFRWSPRTTIPLPRFLKRSAESNDTQVAKISTASTTHDTMDSQPKISIRIISGSNLGQSGTNSTNVDIELTLSDSNQIITTQIGGEAILPIESLHSDYLNPNSLNGTIAINIYEQTPSKTFVGSIEIPLTAVCSGNSHNINRMGGMFKVTKPRLILGPNVRNIDTKSPRNKSANVHNHAQLNLAVSMEPNVPKMNPSMAELPSGDVPYLTEYLLHWNERYNASFPHRKFSLLVIDSTARTTCIIRYIKPLEPPQMNPEGFDLSPEQCARFVSLIPFTSTNQFYQNIWLSVDQFLHLMIGSIVDHAVALCCYFLALKMEAWLLLGFGVPHGNTAFVLVKEYESLSTNESEMILPFCVYDVVQGEKYYLGDSYCPLQKIYCLINENNIWANAQRTDDIKTTRYDLSRRSDWAPVFGTSSENKKIPPPTNTVHGKIIYTPPPNVNDLEIIIDRKIRKTISKLRPMNRTIWNHDVSNAFKSTLYMFEGNLVQGKNNYEVLQKLKHIVGIYEIEGLVFTVPFTKISDVAKRVKTVGVHQRIEEGDDAVVGLQFASAVFIKSYPNQVLGVWIFIGSVKEK